MSRVKYLQIDLPGTSFYNQISGANFNSVRIRQAAENSLTLVKNTRSKKVQVGVGHAECIAPIARVGTTQKPRGSGFLIFQNPGFLVFF